MLIRLCGCAGWSAPLLFAYGIRQVFSWQGSIYKWSLREDHEILLNNGFAIGNIYTCLTTPWVNHDSLSSLMRLWYFSFSVNSFFKRACAATQWGYSVASDFWSDPSSTSLLHVCEQRRLWRRLRGCAGWPESFTVRLCDKYHNLMSWLINFLQFCKCSVFFSFFVFYGTCWAHSLLKASANSFRFSSPLSILTQAPFSWFATTVFVITPGGRFCSFSNSEEVKKRVSWGTIALPIQIFLICHDWGSGTEKKGIWW